MKNSPPPTPSHDEIAERAHTIWIQAGRPDGQDLEHWLQAESELRKERQRISGAMAAPTATAERTQGGELVGAGSRRASANPFRRAVSSAK